MASLSAHPRYRQARAWVFAHKGVSALVAIALVSGVYSSVKAAGAVSADPHYVIAAAALGTVSSSVSGTGQVSASDEVDLSAKSAGTITAVNVAPGAHVKAGQVLVATDATDDAFALENAQISLDRLTNPKASDQQSAVAANESALVSGVSALAKAYADDDSVIAGLANLLDVNDGYLASTNLLLSGDARTLISTANLSYGAAKRALAQSEAANASISNSSSVSDVEAALASTADVAKQVATAASDAQTAVAYVAAHDSPTNAAAASSARSTASGFTSSANGAVSSLLSARTSLVNAGQSLSDLTNPDTLDLRSAQLSVRQKQEAYDDHFVTAPFDGIVGSVDAHVGDQSSGTLVTLVTNDEIAELSLNEVDAAKVAVGQKAMLTFDAVDGLTIAGEVASIDAVGTVSSGVVNYGVKISFATDDPRVKPGMTVEATIITARKDGVVAVPNAAIHSAGDTSYVLRIPGAAAGAGGAQGITGTPTQVPVELGLAGDDTTEITSGLAAGDTYVARAITAAATSAASSATRATGAITAPVRATGAGAVRVQRSPGFGG